jgi:hypothetical protein
MHFTSGERKCLVRALVGERRHAISESNETHGSAVGALYAKHAVAR